MAFSSIAILSLYFLLIDAETGERAVRMIRNKLTSPSYSVGVVQIYHNGNWGNICNDIWLDAYSANVICRQLSFTGAHSYESNSEETLFDTDYNLTAVEDVDCGVNADYSSLSQCALSSQYSISCSDDDLDLVLACYSFRIWNDPYTGQIRLVDGKYSNQGLLEVYCNGQWGTVCGDHFNATDAQVACRQLGYSTYYSFNSLSITGTSFQSIWYENVPCTDNTLTCLSQCQKCPSTATSSCSHANDVTLDCGYNSTEPVPPKNEICSPGVTGERAMRLVRNGYTSQYYGSGIVQIYHEKQWGNICDDSSFTQTEANVICRQLTFTGASSYSSSSLGLDYGIDPAGTAFEDVSCSSAEYLTLSQCTLVSQYTSFCADDTNDLVVTCYSSKLWDNPFSGQLRLTRDTSNPYSYSNQGLLEVYCNGQWGTVCNDGFDDIDAEVVCRQLGYISYFDYNHLSSLTGTAGQKVWLDQVSCPSNISSSCLSDCQTCPSSAFSCSQNKDITIDCGYFTNKPVPPKDLHCTPDTGDRAVRLIRNGVTDQSYDSGIVQIYSYHNFEWGNICVDDSFGMNEANVICRQLQYTGAVSFTVTGLNSTYGVDSTNTAVESVSCSDGNYLSLSQCTLSDQQTPSCAVDANDLFLTCQPSRIWESPYVGQIRLAGGDHSNQGILEVYCNGQWGTVCDSGFSTPDARVACRQLGYSTYYSFDLLPLKGRTSQSIWLSGVSCSSVHKCISDCKRCPNTPVTSLVCDHNEDVTLDCGYDSKATVPMTTEEDCDLRVNITRNTQGPASEGVVRLYYQGSTSSSNTAGEVQVWINGEWTNICYDENFGKDEGSVICHQLGYEDVLSTSASPQLYGNDQLPANISQVSCPSSDYLTLSQCSFTVSATKSCLSSDAAVGCYSSHIWDDPKAYKGQIRLVGGDYSNQGLLEVYCNFQWGSVCDETFGDAEAITVCRQLGYATYYDYNHLNLHSSRPLWLDDLECFNSSNCLLSCSQAACPPPFLSDNNDECSPVTIECVGSTDDSSSNTQSTCNDDITVSPPTSSDDGGDDSEEDGGGSVFTIGGSTAGGVALMVALVVCGCCIYCCCDTDENKKKRRRDGGNSSILGDAMVAVAIAMAEKDHNPRPAPAPLSQPYIPTVPTGTGKYPTQQYGQSYPPSYPTQGPTLY